MEDNKTFSEVYLETEQLLIDQLYQNILDAIKEKKRILSPDSVPDIKEEYLEYFFCNRRIDYI